MQRYAIDTIDQHAALFRGKRLGLITNPSGVNSSFAATATLLAERFDLVALFGPEHGVHGNLQAGVEAEPGRNALLGIPEYSLYGKTGRLTADRLDGVDLMVFDIQDIGSRYYTYIYTMGQAMADCAAAGVPFAVLDRPNPLGGLAAEGTLIRPAFHSFVGNYGLPARHPLTIGEMARRINRVEQLGCDLTVVPCPRWDGAPFPPGGSWLNPSPNMPSATTARVYNGTCLFEGTNISEGRGTTRPYEIIGAPFVPHERLAATLNERRLPGVRFRPCCFTPTFSKHQGEMCRGVQLHVTDCDAFNGFEAGVTLFQTLRGMTPEFEISSPTHLNHLFGDDALLRGEEPLESLLARGRAESAAFLRETAQDRLYGNVIAPSGGGCCTWRATLLR